jgi:CubicO group peptidase (beta-lactamase class C family)
MFTIVTARKLLYLKYCSLQPFFNASIMIYIATLHRSKKEWNDMDSHNINELEKIISSNYGNTLGILVHKNGETKYEHYFNGYTPDKAAHIFSVTKSIISILMGIAIERGYIRSIDQKVLEFFPNYSVKRGEKTIQCVTLRDLITMTAPFKYKAAPYTKYFTSDSWVKAALDLLGGRGEIGQFRYTPLIGPDILSGILTSATGRTVLEFAVENLFSPLGIEVTENVIFHTKEEQLDIMKNYNSHGWVADPQGINTAAWGLFLTPVDMAKIGKLYLNRGVYNGKQIVSSEWIDESTAVHSRWDKLSYGYLWWIIDEKEHSFAALGDGGNVIYVNPEKNIVIVIASLFKPLAKDRIELIKAYIEPMFDCCGS